MFFRKIYWLWLLLCGFPQVTMAIYTYETCNSVDDKQLQVHIEKGIEEQLKDTQLKPEEIGNIVLQQWQTLNIASTIAAETDKTIAKIKNTSGYWERYGSSWGSAAADKFANQVSTEVFTSEAFKTKLMQLTEAYIKQTQSKTEQSIQQAGNEAVKCLQTFAESKYGRIFSVGFNTNLNKNPLISNSKYLENTQLGGASNHSIAGAGAAIALAGNQLIRVLAQKVTQRVTAGVAARIAGKIATRAVPLIGWAVAAYDFVASADGVLPDIAKTLKSVETQKIIQDQLVDAFSTLLLDKELIHKMAETLYGEWKKFKDNHQQVINLAENSPEFKKTLNEIPVNDFEKLANTTSSLLRVFGQTETIKSAEAGDIRKLSAMPENTLEILHFSKDKDIVFQWYALADEQNPRMEKLVELEIFKYKQPRDLTKQQLSQLLLLNNRKMIAGLIMLKPSDFETLLALPQETLEILSPQLDKSDWETIAWYVRQLTADVEARKHFLDVIVKYNSTFKNFQSDTAKQQIVSAKDRIFTMDELAGLHTFWLSRWVGFDLPNFMNWIMLLGGLIVFYVLYKLRSLLKSILSIFKRAKPTEGINIDVKTPNH